MDTLERSALQTLLALRALARRHLTPHEAAGVTLMGYDARIHDRHPATRFSPTTVARRAPGGLILVRLDHNPLELDTVVLHELGHHVTLDPTGRFHPAYTRASRLLAGTPRPVRRGLVEGAADAVATDVWGSRPCPTYERRAAAEPDFRRGYSVGRAFLTDTPRS